MIRIWAILQIKRERFAARAAMQTLCRAIEFYAIYDLRKLDISHPIKRE